MRLWLTGTLDEVKRAGEAVLADAVVANPATLRQWTEGRASVGEALVEVVEAVRAPLYVQLRGPGRRRFLEQFTAFRGACAEVMPMLPATVDGLAATHDLATAGEAVLVTGVCALQQAFLAGVAGASFVSPPYGRLMEAGFDADALIRDGVDLFAAAGGGPEVVPDGVRSTRDVEEVLRAGAQGVVVSLRVFYESFEHGVSLSTLERFERDWQNIPGA